MVAAEIKRNVQLVTLPEIWKERFLAKVESWETQEGTRRRAQILGMCAESPDPQAVIGLFSLGVTGGSIACGGCTFVAPTVLGAGLLVGGQATYPIAIPCNAALLNFQLDAQGAVLGTTNNLCPIVPQASASPARRYTLAE